MTAPLPAKTAPVKPAGVELPFGYPLFGLYFRTNFPLPGLAASENPDLPEVPMHLGTEPPGFAADRYTELVHTSPFQGESGAPILVIRASEKGEYWLKYEEGTDVFTNSGIDELWVTWRAGSCLEDAATFLMGSVMAIVSQLRGSVCLHGCAVVIDGRVAALLGPQGAGKSTTAAAFASAGHAIAADDLVLLSERDGRFWVTPTCPIVRLWPSSVESLFGHEDALPRITEGWDKRWLNLRLGGVPVPDGTSAACILIYSESPERGGFGSVDWATTNVGWIVAFDCELVGALYVEAGISGGTTAIFNQAVAVDSDTESDRTCGCGAAPGASEDSDRRCAWNRAGLMGLLTARNFPGELSIDMPSQRKKIVTHEKTRNRELFLW